MYLYLLVRQDFIDYDEYDAFVVAALSEQDARELAAGRDSDLCDRWLDSEIAICERIGRACPATKRGIILESYNAG